VAWVPYYNITSTVYTLPKIIVIDYTISPPQLISVHPPGSDQQIDFKYLLPYPSRSVVALSSNTIAWCPQDGKTSIVTYSLDTNTINTINERISPSVSFATATTVNDSGDVVMVGTYPDDTSISTITPAGSTFESQTGGTTYKRYEDVCLTANGEVFLAPAYNNSFVVHNPQLPEEQSWRTIGPISFATSGIRMGGCTTSSADPNTVYSVPFNHNRILAVNLVDGSVQQFGSFLEAGRNLYQGVIEAGEYLFGIPYSSNDILIIDPLNTNPSQRATTLSLQSPYRGSAMCGHPRQCDIFMQDWRYTDGNPKYLQRNFPRRTARCFRNVFGCIPHVYII
jgi:hypothetical protein